MTVFEQLLVTRSATALPKPKMIPASTPPPVARPPAPLAAPKELGRVATQPLTARPLKPPPPIPKITPLKPIPEPVPAPIEPAFESAPTKIAAELERDVKTAVKADLDDAPPERDTKTDLEPEAVRAESVPAPAEETRTPGSELVLPANPLMNLSDESLEGYVDCTLYEETGNFFPADDPTNFIDDVVPSPLLAPRPALARMSGPIEVAVSRLSAPIDVPPLPSYVSYAPAAPPDALQPPPPTEDTTGTTIPPPLSPTPQPFPTYAPPDPPALAQPTIPPPIAVAAEPRVDLEPRARRRPRVWLIAGAGAGAALLLTILIVSKGGKTSAAAPAEAKSEVKNMVAQVDPTPQPAVADTPPAAPEPAEQEPPASEGPPVVGSGPCRIAVASTPAGSMVSVDGNSMGPSPITIATACGKRKIAVEHARYLTATRFASLAEGTPGSLDVTLMRPTHAVSITSQPSGATVFIDGRRAGTTPTVINVMGFQNLDLEVKKAGFQTTVTKLYSKKAQDKVSIKLARW
jgi:hypothetical protein